jgi:preprotein translocase subunit YajC
MEFFISNAYAQGAQPGSGLGMILPMVIIFVAFWFLLIRPQQKKQKAHAALVSALSVGDEVMTAGGILGKITNVTEHYAAVEIADGTVIKVQKMSVSQVVPRGTYDAA